MLYAIADCNSFYVSCERVFEPKLEGRPVVVLSSNDRNIIAKSNEAKTLGINKNIREKRPETNLFRSLCAYLAR